MMTETTAGITFFTVAMTADSPCVFFIRFMELIVARREFLYSTVVKTRFAAVATTSVLIEFLLPGIVDAMDIFAHSLWTYAAARVANRKLARKGKKPLHVGWATFFGVWPDLFAGAVPFVGLGISFLTGKLTALDFSRVNIMEHASPRVDSLFGLWATLYHWSHSIPVFLIVFGLIWLFLRRPVWELLGWLFHILIDMPTHSAAFYPTPFIWPFSDFRVSGVSWGETWFMIANYSALLVVFIFLFWRNKNPSKG